MNVPLVEVYRKRWMGVGSWQWRWRVTAANNRIIGASTESYHNMQDCLNNMVMVREALNYSQSIEIEPAP